MKLSFGDDLEAMVCTIQQGSQVDNLQYYTILYFMEVWYGAQH
jgi:hypothetical protein